MPHPGMERDRVPVGHQGEVVRVPGPLPWPNSPVANTSSARPSPSASTPPTLPVAPSIVTAPSAGAVVPDRVSERRSHQPVPEGAASTSSGAPSPSWSATKVPSYESVTVARTAGVPRRMLAPDTIDNVGASSSQPTARSTRPSPS